MTDNSRPTPATSFVKASSRSEAVKKMISRDPLLSELYEAGEQKDGKAGWVNAIKDQSHDYYRLLFYIFKIPVAPEHTELEPYEVLYGSIEPSSELNYPRALFTTTGAINLMRDGLPGEEFVRALKRGILQITPYTLGRDLPTKTLLENGSAYLGIYDRDGQGIRILDLRDYSIVYDHREREEIQVHNEEDLIIGETRFVRPFLLKYKLAPKEQSAGTSELANEAIQRLRK